MYKLKEGITWKDIKDTYDDGAAVNFEDEFEKVDLPVIELKENNGKNVKIGLEEGYMYKIEKLNDNVYGIEISSDYGTTIQLFIGENELIKSVVEFNEKCALLFGFYLKEI